jgi:excisionase family DNA binding protein
MSSQAQSQPQPPLLLRPREVAVTLGISTGLTYRMLSEGALPVVRFGTGIRVPYADLLLWIDKNKT